MNIFGYMEEHDRPYLFAKMLSHDSFRDYVKVNKLAGTDEDAQLSAKLVDTAGRERSQW